MARRNAGPVLHLGDDKPVELPFKWEICGCCAGHGKSTRYLGAFTGEQMREDPDFADDYMSGRYDRECETCGGTGKTKQVDRSRMTPAQRAAWRAQCADDAEIEAIHRAELRAEGCWRDMGAYG